MFQDSPTFYLKGYGTMLAKLHPHGRFGQLYPMHPIINSVKIQRNKKKRSKRITYAKIQKKTSKQKLLLLFDNNKIKMARKPWKKQKENTVGCTGEGER